MRLPYQINDGKVSLSDIIIIKKYIAGSISLSEKLIKVADYNKDGNVSSTDVLDMQKNIAGM